MILGRVQITKRIVCSCRWTLGTKENWKRFFLHQSMPLLFPINSFLWCPVTFISSINWLNYDIVKHFFKTQEVGAVTLLCYALVFLFLFLTFHWWVHEGLGVVRDFFVWCLRFLKSFIAVQVESYSFCSPESWWSSVMMIMGSTVAI